MRIQMKRTEIIIWAPQSVVSSNHKEWEIVRCLINFSSVCSEVYGIFDLYGQCCQLTVTQSEGDISPDSPLFWEASDSNVSNSSPAVPKLNITAGKIICTFISFIYFDFWNTFRNLNTVLVCWLCKWTGWNEGCRVGVSLDAPMHLVKMKQLVVKEQ